MREDGDEAVGSLRTRLGGSSAALAARLKTSELTPGTLALCAVREVHSSRAILSLPDGHLGLLERLELSDELHAEIAGGGFQSNIEKHLRTRSAFPNLFSFEVRMVH